MALAASAAPIRVLIYQLCGNTGYVHAAINSGSPRLAAILKNPAAANLGTGVVIPPDGFTVDILGPAAGGNGTTDDGHALITALATHDVLILNNNTAIGNLLTTTDRQALLTWASKHGLVGFHGAADSHSLWPAWDSLTGGLFTTHVVADAKVALDSAPASLQDPVYSQINAGVPKSATFNEEWYSYQSNPRSAPGVHVAAILDEKSYTPVSRMGDHPISWYRENPAGGRMFYSGIGHMQEIFLENQWFRRQAYNAVLYVARVGTVDVRASQRPSNSGERAKASRTTITVSFASEGKHSVELADLAGRRVASASGTGERSHAFSNLKPNTVYAVITTTKNGRSRRLVTTQ
jgi:type 1 glutamine amidotransferase